MMEKIVAAAISPFVKESPLTNVGDDVLVGARVGGVGILEGVAIGALVGELEGAAVGG